jgi:hypothetical protein
MDLLAKPMELFIDLMDILGPIVIKLVIQKWKGLNFAYCIPNITKH